MESKSCRCKQRKRGINLLLFISRHMSSHFLESGASVYLTVAWQDKYLNHKHQLCLLLPLSFHCRAQYHMAWNIYLVNQGQLPRLCSLPNSQLQPTHFGAGYGERVNILMLCKNGSAKSKTLACYQNHFIHKYKAQHHGGCCEGRLLNPSQSQYIC